MSKVLHDAFCGNVRQRRSDLGLTQRDMAERLKMSQPSYWEIETGRFLPGLDLIDRVAVALECTAAELLTIPKKARQKQTI